MENLRSYLTEEDKDYKYGNPYKAAKNLIANLKEVEKILNDSNGHFDLAGEFLSPGIKESFKKDLMNLINETIN